MSRLIFKNFIKTNPIERELILSWRNSDRIRSKMETSEIISMDRHLNFICGLSSRKDCVYWLVILDTTPIAVTYDTEIDMKQKTCSGGMYIGDRRFVGYGVPILYFSYLNYFENMMMKENVFKVLKTNKRVYVFHKNIFHARDKYETHDAWFLYHNMSTFLEMKHDLEPRIKSIYNVGVMREW